MIIKKEAPQSTDWHLEFGELKDDADFVGKCENLVAELIGLQKKLENLLQVKKASYEELTLDEKIDLDLLLVYTLNSLHWIDLRLQGIDVSKHPIKRELDRIKAAMLRWRQVKDRDKRPKVNVDAAKRFVRSGLYDHTQNGDTPPNKKIRFD